jgi:hypothetical protein
MPRVRDGAKVNLTPDLVHHSYAKPSEQLLLLHASVARVLKISGRGEKYEKLWRDFEDTKTRANDGSSMDLLNMAVALAKLHETNSEDEKLLGYSNLS